jgi:hypothetical protein
MKFHLAAFCWGGVLRSLKESAYHLMNFSYHPRCVYVSCLDASMWDLRSWIFSLSMTTTMALLEDGGSFKKWSLVRDRQVTLMASLPLFHTWAMGEPFVSRYTSCHLVLPDHGFKSNGANWSLMGTSKWVRGNESFYQIFVTLAES